MGRWGDEKGRWGFSKFVSVWPNFSERMADLVLIVNGLGTLRGRQKKRGEEVHVEEKDIKMEEKETKKKEEDVEKVEKGNEE